MNSEHNGIATRPPASAQLLVASTDRYNQLFDRLLFPKTSANWILNKQYNILNGYFTRLAITQLNINWNLPTIVEGKNDIFNIIFEDDGVETDISILIPEGFYSGAELADEIETLVKAHPDYDNLWLFNVVYGAGNFNFFVANTYEIVFTPQDLVPPVTAQEIAINRLYATIGINIDNFDFAVTQVGGPAPMVYTRWLDIISSRLTQFQRVKDASTQPQTATTDIIARVYASPPNVLCNGDSFSLPWNTTIDYNTPKHIKWEVNQAVNNFDIQVYDEWNELMYWTPQYATEYNFTFLASET
jgi:hypothetical protein